MSEQKKTSYNKDYYEKNKERIKERTKELYEANKDKINERRRATYMNKKLVTK